MGLSSSALRAGAGRGAVGDRERLGVNLQGEAEHRRQALQRVERRVSLTVLYQVDAILARSYDCSVGNCVSLSKAMFDSSRYRSNIFRAKASASISPCRPPTCLVLRR